MNSQKNRMYVMMVIVTFVWGLEYIFAKQALEAFEPLTLVFFKYLVGIIAVLTIKLKMEGKSLVRKKDIPMFILCAVFGEIGYFFFEYSAITYLPVSIVTIVLAFVPALSILLDKVIYKRKITPKMLIGVILCIAGIALVIGIDYEILFQGRLIGYIFAFLAVAAWNAYNFITASLHEHYESASLTLNQLVCTILILWPYAIANLPEPSTISLSIVGGILYLGLVSTGIGFIMSVKSLHVLGPTTTAMFSNFLPVTTTFFGWILLGETISFLQMIGGAIVIAAGCIVIKEKGRVEDLTHDGTQ